MFYVEHSFAKLYRVISINLVILLCVVTLAGCKKAILNPETIDPIYADLLAQAAGIHSKAESQKKKIEELRVQIEKLSPRDPALKHTEHERENLERGLVQIEQDATYYEIRAEQRRLYDKQSYEKAFKADLDWPSPAEFSEYKESKRLRNSSRNWEDKVPKSTQYNKPVPEKKKKKEEKKAE